MSLVPACFRGRGSACTSRRLVEWAWSAGLVVGLRRIRTLVAEVVDDVGELLPGVVELDEVLPGIMQLSLGAIVVAPPLAVPRSFLKWILLALDSYS